ncbi:MAG: metal ABC transporter ATP-binding protein [Candidatus Bathyarchaeota archaeon]|nr:metal ABC transporter ATP-binding protein [Candidatus Bathyarchaeota archaeon]
MTLAIELNNVSTVYEGEKRPAIKDITLSIEEGETVYIVGPNAAGKTTLLETINGLLPVFKGYISVLGLDMRKHGRKIRCQIGYVPQDFMVDAGEPYRALDVVLMGRYGKVGVLGSPGREDKDKAIEAMKLLGIENLANRPVGKLSGGQQQKVMIARALAKDPRILLLDEPFSSLDPESRENLSELISRLSRERNVTVLVVTHDIQQIAGSCGRIIAMNNGRIVADGELMDVIEVVEKILPIGFWRKQR